MGPVSLWVAGTITSWILINVCDCLIGVCNYQNLKCKIWMILLGYFWPLLHKPSMLWYGHLRNWRKQFQISNFSFSKLLDWVVVLGHHSFTSVHDLFSVHGFWTVVLCPWCILLVYSGDTFLLFIIYFYYL